MKKFDAQDAQTIRNYTVEWYEETLTDPTINYCNAFEVCVRCFKDIPNPHSKKWFCSEKCEDRYNMKLLK